VVATRHPPHKPMKKELSPKQLEANRQNALKSTGPRTAAGRNISKRNAAKHGLRAADIVITAGRNPEDPEAFEELFNRLTDHYLPVGALEEFFVERVAVCIWRLYRVCRVEREETTRSIEEAELIISHRSVCVTVKQPVQLQDSPQVTNRYVPYETYQAVASELEDAKKALERKERQAAAAAVGSPFLPMHRVEIIQRYETTIERSLYKALDQLDRLQLARKGESIPPPLNLRIT